MNIHSEKGLSLIEIAVVLIIFGFISSTMIFVLNLYAEETRVRNTLEALEDSETVLNRFEALTGSLPCPARLDLGPGDVGYGLSLAETEADPVLGTNAFFQVDTYSRRARTNLDTDPVNEDFVYGAIPINSINNNIIMQAAGTGDFTPKDSVDGWGNKLLYAVSRHLCDPNYLGSDGSGSVQASTEGVLDIVTEATCVSQNPARLGDNVPQSVLPGGCEDIDRKFAQFVILSHGPNGRGAFTREGNRISTCTGIVIELPPGDPNRGLLNDGDWFNSNASERKNCRYDRDDTVGTPRLGEFFTGLRNEDDDEEYDDYLRFAYKDEFQIFEITDSLPDDNGTPGDPTDDFDIPRMKNVNAGDIGIGVQIPDELLHIDGDLQAFDIHANEYCADIDTDLCMPVEVLTTTGIRCPSGGEAIRSIENNMVNCVDPFAGQAFNCPPGQRLQRVRSDGTFTCIIP